jgi:serine/threonine protein kinase
MADRVGQQLGNYRLLRLLGEGGFAEVYLAEQVYLKTFAAIKVLHTRLANDDLDGFLSEARTIAALKHPPYCARAGLWREGRHTLPGNGRRAGWHAARAHTV